MFLLEAPRERRSSPQKLTPERLLHGVPPPQNVQARFSRFEEWASDHELQPHMAGLPSDSDLITARLRHISGAHSFVKRLVGRAGLIVAIGFWCLLCYLISADILQFAEQREVI